MIKAVVFDMDGVLIEAKDWHYQSLNKALGLFGYEISLYDHLKTYDGLPTARKLEMLSVERGFPKFLHELVNDLKQIYTMEMVYTSCKPRFVHEYALSKLKSSGYKLAVASNSIRKTVEAMMQCADLDKYLDLKLSNNDVQRAKPYPDIYLKAMEILEVKPSQCVVVEDNEKGVQAATKAGAHVLQVDDVNEVNYQNIIDFICRINKMEDVCK